MLVRNKGNPADAEAIDGGDSLANCLSVGFLYCIIIFGFVLCEYPAVILFI